METNQPPSLILPQLDDPLQQPLPAPLSQDDNATPQPTEGESKPRRTRSKWSKEETDDLIKGCAIHGVGNWKKYVPFCA